RVGKATCNVSEGFRPKGKQEIAERLSVRSPVPCDFCKDSFANPGQRGVNLSRRTERDGRLGGRPIKLLRDAIEANPRDLVPRTLLTRSSRLSCWHVLAGGGGHDDVTVSAREVCAQSRTDCRLYLREGSGGVQSCAAGDSHPFAPPPYPLPT